MTFRQAIKCCISKSIDALLKLIDIAMPSDEGLQTRSLLAGKSAFTTEVGGLTFYCNHPLVYLRAREFMRAEPDMLHWIDNHVDENSVFYDVGANIGAYSLYAASRHGTQAIAFEPVASNFDILARNIALNGLSSRITTIPLALHDSTGIETLYLSKFDPGGGIHSVHEPRAGSQGETFDAVASQTILTFRIDDLIKTFDLPRPTHVKIDVDGNDRIVLEGLGELLDDPVLRGIAIEVNETVRAEDASINDFLAEHGFHRRSDTALRNEANIARGKAYNAYFERI